jgi:integrase
MKLDEIGPAKIEEWRAKKLAEGLSRKSANNLVACLARLLRLAVEWGALKQAPRVKLLRLEPSEFQFLHFEEVPRFLSAVPVEWRTFVVLALKTGLRLGELLALRWEDVDLVAGRLVVRRTIWMGHEGSPKSGRNCEVPLSGEAVAVLQAHRHLRGPHVFCKEDGRQLTHSLVRDIVPAACRRAGLAKRLTMHDLRHSFACHLVMRGVALKAVQELLGHATIEMTMKYAHLTPDVRRDAVQLLDAPRVGGVVEAP